MTRRTTALYIDALRHMRPRQLLSRPRRLIAPRWLGRGLPPAAQKDFTTKAAGLGAPEASQFGPVADPAVDGVFSALGFSRSIPSDDLWRPETSALQFMFHLHGFEQLATYAAGARSASHDRFWAGVVESWLDTESDPKLPAWHPYPTSRRLVAWCSAVAVFSEWNDSLRRRLAGEIARQAQYLRRTVEYDIGGNHVLKNAVALVFAGVTVPASGVLGPGLRLLERELSTQILSDGGHEERSTSYHREVGHDLSAIAELLSRSRLPVSDQLEDARSATADWQAAIAGPDGRLPMLNDAWEGPPLDLGARDQSAVTVLAGTGHVVLCHRDDRAVFDCGPLCPRHLPAHAHADALSFVVWLDGQLVVSDPGAYIYSGLRRNDFRGTAAHATVEVDGLDQCEFWGDFRAAFLPRVAAPRLQRCEDVVVVESLHDGYRRLPDPVVHHRAFAWVPGSGFVVVDRLSCERPHLVRSTLPLAPGVNFEDGHLLGRAVAPLTASGAFQRESSEYAPALGQLQRTVALVSTGSVLPGRAFGWSVLSDGARARMAGGETLEIARPDRATPVRISLASIR